MLPAYTVQPHRAGGYARSGAPSRSPASGGTFSAARKPCGATLRRSPPPNITWKHRRRREAATTACERSFRAWRHPFSKSIPDAPVAVQARDPVIFCYLRSRLVLPKPVAGFLSGAGAVGLTLEITASSGSGFFTA